MGISDRLAALTAVAMQEAGADLARVVTRGHTAAFIAGTAERLNIKPDSPLLSARRLSRAERAEIDRAVKGQLEYLRGFEQARGGLSDAQARARGDMYANATRETYSRARWFDYELPYHPCQGTECLTNCRCEWKVEGDTATWVLSDTRHCETCSSRAAANPHQVRRRGE